MSFLKHLFKNKNKEQHNTDNSKNPTPKKKLSINELEFTKISSEEKDRVWEKMTTGAIPEEEQAKVRREMLDKCKMTTLADNDVKLYRMAKSSDDIAKKSIEHWKQIEHKPHSVVEANPDGHGISLTTAEALILCIPYGDMVTEVVFDNERLKENKMDDHFVYKVGHLFDEYLATKILTGNMWSIANPETLKMVIDMSSDASFEKALTMSATENYSINTALFKFGFNNTLTYWEKIQDRYCELSQMNLENRIGILRIELGKLLKDTPTVGNDIFNGSESINLTTKMDEVNKEY